MSYVHNLSFNFLSQVQIKLFISPPTISYVLYSPCFKWIQLSFFFCILINLRQ